MAIEEAITLKISANSENINQNAQDIASLSRRVSNFEVTEWII